MSIVRRTNLFGLVILFLIAAWAASLRGGEIYAFDGGDGANFVYLVSPHDGGTSQIALMPPTTVSLAYVPKMRRFFAIRLVASFEDNPTIYRAVTSVNLPTRSASVIRKDSATEVYSFVGIAYNPADELLYTMTNDAEGKFYLEQFDPRSGALLHTLPPFAGQSPGSYVTCFTIDAAGHLWTLSNQLQNGLAGFAALQELDLQTGQVLSSAGLFLQVGEWYGQSLLADPDNGKLYTYHSTPFDSATGEQQLQLGTLDSEGRFTVVSPSTRARSLVWVP